VFKLLESFGLSLNTEKSGAPAKKTAKPVKTVNKSSDEPSKKSYSWGY